MQRRILKALALIVIALPTHVFALGLGDLTVYSALNQPLDAEIDITAATPGEAKSLIVKLGSQKDFIKANIERPFLLTKLQFSIATKQNGNAVIKIKTKNAIREPFLNFLVDAEWPQGRLLREYTILLDPPSFAMQSSAVQSIAPEAVEPVVNGSKVIDREPTVPAPTVEIEDDSLFLGDGVDSEQSDNQDAGLNDDVQVDESSIEDDSQDSGVVSEKAQSDMLDDVAVGGELPEVNVSLNNDIPYNPESIVNADTAPLSEEVSSLLSGEEIFIYRETETQSEPEPQVAQKNEYTVQSGDYMQAIAEQFKPESVDVNQAMLAILQYNPSAFINNNVNLVKRGKTLSIPSQDEMMMFSVAQANQQVRNQNALWREYKQKLSSAYETEPSENSGSSNAQAIDRQGRDDILNEMPSNNDIELALVTPKSTGAEQGKHSNNAGASGDRESIKNQLTIMQEELSAAELKRQDIESTLTDLKSINNKSQGIINLKSQKMAELQKNAEQQSGEQVAGKDEVSNNASNLGGGANNANETPSQSTDNKQKTETSKPAKPVIKPEPYDPRPEGLGGIVYDILPASLKEVLLPLLSGNTFFMVLGALAALVLLLVWFVLKKRGGGDDFSFDGDATTQFDTGSSSVGGSSLMDKVKGLFKKKTNDENLDLFNESSDGLESSVEEIFQPGSSDEEDSLLLDASESPAEETQLIEPEPSASKEEGDDISDDTTAEADVYIAYNLYDQAEDLLKQAIDENPNVPAYRGKLLETYFNANKKEEFIEQAGLLRQSLGGATSAVWNKAVVLGKEIAPNDPIFSQESVSGNVKASDFEVEKPMSADIDLDAGEAEETADFNLGDTGEIDLDQTLIQSPADDEINSDVVSLLGDENKEEIDADDLTMGFDEGDEPDLSIAFDEGDFGLGADDNTSEFEAPQDSEDEFDLDIGDDTDASEFSINEGGAQDDGDSADLSLNFGDVSSSESSLDLDVADDVLDEVVGDFDVELGIEEDQSIDIESLDLTPEETGVFDLESESVLSALDGESDALVTAGDDDFSAIEDDLESLSSLSFEDKELENDMESLLGDASNDGVDVISEDSLVLDDDSMETSALDDSMFDDADMTNMLDDSSIDELSNDLTQNDEDIPDNLDEVGTKLDLAKAYIDMGDEEGARLSLEEVIEDGNAAQKQEAESLINSLA